MYLINIQTIDDPKNQSICKAESIDKLLGIIRNATTVHGTDITKITIKIQ